jgi:hypothetical protein
MRGWPLLAAACAAFLPGSAAAQSVVASARPDRVAVTVYRAPGRSSSTPIELDWLNGYALISETRQVSIPAGESEIRFEGVAGGILPQSAIVTGFPEGIIERNRDAYLLSPSTLLDRSLGRRVTLRRTSRATGEVREEEAIIRSGAGGAVVLQTPVGFEALQCTGMTETIVYPSVPEGLTPTPTLSVRARASQPATATVTLSYLASGFDWQANYVAELSRDGRRVDLFAWLTLASMDETSFPDADTQAVAGRLNRERTPHQPREGGPLQLRCWPQGRTSDIAAARQEVVVTARRARLGAVAGAAYDEDAAEAIVVTGSRIMARQEELGDLKLYRIAEPVTVAANSQKQVAFLQRPNVRAEIVYRQRLDPEDNDDEFRAANRVLVTRNREEEGLGVPLPAGRVVLFASGEVRPVLIGEGHVDDRAVGEDVEIVVGEATGVMTRIAEIAEDEDGDWEDYELTVTNDRSRPVRFEGEFDVDTDDVVFTPRGRRLPLRDGRPLWRVTVAANGSATLRYRIIERDD